ncbi:hypothetical protein [Nocardia cyriacigeorgica]|uniref:hypothetical protein n=1 Tax=Nocardia cyriacigeorgica TaxID=135487 RepID=UPI0024580C18|nr:hypothetical protein [Nocardia cyriacigeorgica]
MSFLIRRNLPWAWAGWFDDFNRPPENPIKQPWNHFGDGAPAILNSVGEMEIPSNYNSVAGGGESYEFMPFTPNFGIEWEMYWPAGGATAQYFNLFIIENWAKVGVNYANLLCIRLRHRIDAVGGDDIAIWEFNSFMTPGREIVVAQVPQKYEAGTTTVRVWIDRDMLVRVWVNNTYLLQAVPTANHRTGPERRGINFMNAGHPSAWVRWTKIYDRPTDFHTALAWNNTVIDDNFNRADGAVGNGWTQLGADAGLVGGSWSHISGNDTSVGLIRDTGVTHGAQRIEAVIGGNVPPHADRDSSLILRTNATGSEGLAANFYSGGVFLARFTGSLQSPTFHDFVSTAATITAGDTLAFSCNGEGAWIERNGQIILLAHLNGTVSGTNRYVGLRVERDSFNDSASWNSAKVLTPF